MVDPRGSRTIQSLTCNRKSTTSTSGLSLIQNIMSYSTNIHSIVIIVVCTIHVPAIILHCHGSTVMCTTIYASQCINSVALREISCMRVFSFPDPKLVIGENRPIKSCEIITPVIGYKKNACYRMNVLLLKLDILN